MPELKIVWRNPIRVRHRLRWRRQKQAGATNLYVVQQLTRPEDDVWINSSVLELIRGTPRAGIQEHKPLLKRLGLGK
jgi:hypothetical protein